MLPIENSTVCYLLIGLAPLCGFLVNLLFFGADWRKGAQVASWGVSIGFLGVLAAWATGLPFSPKANYAGLAPTEISWLMAALILFISSIVHHFSRRYMDGDRHYRRYFLLLSLITVTNFLLVAADHALLLTLLWGLSNFQLALLMMHKSKWVAAKHSSLLAGRSFCLGVLFLSIGFGILAYDAGTWSLVAINAGSASLTSSFRFAGLGFITLAALIQSGGYPFHSWLLSSLNSPTPVSAFMHAGLVNGGGLLLARLAPVYFHEGKLLSLIFWLSVTSLVLGGLWKLIQTDIKRMLACSTMTQMGFMMMQCSLGLFPAAIAHLCWHGLFKAFLFLRCGSTIAERFGPSEERVSRLPIFLCSIFCGLFGAFGFMYGSAIFPDFTNAASLLVFFSWMASAQIAHAVIQNKASLFSCTAACLLCLALGVAYGTTVYVVELSVESLHISYPQPISVIHLPAMLFVFCIWVGLNLKIFSNHQGANWWRRFYVSMLNASQPASRTVTHCTTIYHY